MTAFLLAVERAPYLPRSTRTLDPIVQSMLMGIGVVMKDTPASVLIARPQNEVVYMTKQRCTPSCTERTARSYPETCTMFTLLRCAAGAIRFTAQICPSSLLPNATHAYELRVDPKESCST